MSDAGGSGERKIDVDVTTKMHIALAVMLTFYAGPLAYLVWLAQHQHPEAPVQNKPEAEKKRERPPFQARPVSPAECDRMRRRRARPGHWQAGWSCRQGQ